MGHFGPLLAVCSNSLVQLGGARQQFREQPGRREKGLVVATFLLVANTGREKPRSQETGGVFPTLVLVKRLRFPDLIGSRQDYLAEHIR